MRPWIARYAAGALALASSASAAASQEEKVDLKELFHEVERDLAEIDRLLLNASEEQGGESAPAAARDANARQKRVVDTIQRILESIPP